MILLPTYLHTSDYNCEYYFSIKSIDKYATLGKNAKNKIGTLIVSTPYKWETYFKWIDEHTVRTLM